MRLNCYPHPEYGLWISGLAKALKEGGADLHCYNTGPIDTRIKGVMESTFKRLVSQFKWLAISLIFCWLPFRHWLEVRVGEPGKFWPPNGYYLLIGPMLAMALLAFAEVLLCLYEKRSLPKRFEKFKINTIRHFSARPRPPVSRTDAELQEPRLKFWAAFLIVCLLISSIVPVSSAWVIVHPMGGQDYVKAGPTLIRPFSSWYTVPKTHSTIIWVPLRLVENDTKVVMLEVEVEWTITKPLKFKPREWRRILDSAIGFYIHNISESIRNAASIEIKDEIAIQEIIVFQISTNLDIIKEVIESPELGSPEPMKVTKIRIRTVTMSQYSQYYRLMRER